MFCLGIPDAVCRINRCGGCSVEWYSVVTGKTVQCSGMYIIVIMV